MSVQVETVRVVTLDGRHLVLQCQPGFGSRCIPAISGNYEGEVEGNTIWLYMPDLEGKKHKAKYRFVGTWKE
jgi:hypothetical protein